MADKVLNTSLHDLIGLTVGLVDLDEAKILKTRLESYLAEVKEGMSESRREEVLKDLSSVTAFSRSVRAVEAMTDSTLGMTQLLAGLLKACSGGDVAPSISSQPSVAAAADSNKNSHATKEESLAWDMIFNN